MIVIDVDLQLSDIFSLLKAVDFLLSSDRYSAVFPNSRPVYYDVYALRHPIWCPRDVWQEVDLATGNPGIADPEAVFVHSRQIHIGTEAPPIKVDSAFGGMGVYKISHCLGGTYIGRTEDGKESCEHVSFNKSLNGNLFILPFWFVEAPIGHLSASFKTGTGEPPSIAQEPAAKSNPAILFLSKIGRSLAFKIMNRSNPDSVAQQDDNTPNDTKVYRIASYDIILPLDHNLPAYQEEHPLYDKFLQTLAGYLPQDDSLYIVDVGANVGDTAAAMVDRCVQRFICIEGYDPYFAILKQNIDQSLKCPERIFPVNAMIGTGTYSGSLQGDGSTATLGLAGHGTFKSLDSVVLSLGALDKVALLKIDTDGFDGDVISSAQRTLSCSEPLVFWENQFSDPSQEAMLQQAYIHMESLGYRHLWIFDNFGNPILCDCGFDSLLMINKYIAMQQDKKSTRTIYYTDVLACKSRSVGLVERAISAYVQAAPPKL